MRAKFVQFLKSNGAFEKFRNNLESDNPYTYKGFDTYVSFTPAVQYISGAFYFSGTPEGPNYWHDLHMKWMEEIK